MSRPSDRVAGLLLGGVLIIIAAIGLLAPAGVRALTPPNGTAATLVLGQPTFSDSAPGTTQNRFFAPQDVAVDPASGAVFVADTLNNRVLRFASSAALGNGAAAAAVLGQPTFTENSSACTATGMTNPAGIAVDSAGALWWPTAAGTGCCGSTMLRRSATGPAQAACWGNRVSPPATVLLHRQPARLQRRAIWRSIARGGCG